MKAELVKTKSDWRIALYFSFNFDLIAKVKTLDGRRYSEKEKTWYVDVSFHNVKCLQEWGFEVDEKIKVYWSRISNTTNSNSSLNFEVLSKTGKKLFPFQKQGVEFIQSKNGRALIGDEMGLGKTVQALAWCKINPDKQPIVIVCPATLKDNWRNETIEWLETTKIKILSGKTPYPIPKSVKVIIINYDILWEWVNTIKEINPQVLIMDESHYIKNSKAKRTKAVQSLAKHIPHLISLTGTPVMNRPVEIYNTVSLLSKTLFPNKWRFLHRYCAAKYDGFGWNFNGASNTEELHNILVNSIMLRRMKKDVLTELPDKIYSTIELNIDNPQEYREAEKDLVQYVISKYRGTGELQQKVNAVNSAETLVKIEYLKQLAAKGKMKNIISWVTDFLESGNKLVLFTTHKFVIQELMDNFKDVAVKIDGSTAQHKRSEIVDNFQNDPNVKLFIGNIQAAGVGITLTAASHVAIIELPWTPGDLNQAIDRCHRIGQKNAVNVFMMVAKNTIDSKIAKLLEEKSKIVNSVSDGGKNEDMSVFKELLEEISSE